MKQKKKQKVAFVFPGQGSQVVGMSKSFYNVLPWAKEAYGAADEILGFGLSKIALEGPPEELNKTENTQPALLVASLIALGALKASFPLEPILMAGHSLGEYTALVASGALQFTDAVTLVHKRGLFMQEAVPSGTGAMAAVIGLDAAKVEEVCTAASEAESVVVPANINSPAQVVVSGAAEAVERLSLLAKEAGAKRVIPLKVSAPSHSPLMAPAAVRFAEELKSIEFEKPNVPIVSNVKATPTASRKEFPELLTSQLTSPVRWVETIERMKAEGVEVIIEIGPGSVLTGLTKRIDKSIQTYSLASVEDLGELSKVFGEAPDRGDKSW
ncbi:MAG: ACP S-malonyltransferase [Proteobacteria bacterium]|nr:ACP S-malonyltransferase [Pseudomonadota bacterium]